MRIPPGWRFLRLSSSCILVIFWVHLLSSFSSSSAAIYIPSLCPSLWNTLNVFFHGGAAAPEIDLDMVSSSSSSSSFSSGLWNNKTATNETSNNDDNVSPRLSESEIQSFKDNVINAARERFDDNNDESTSTSETTLNAGATDTASSTRTSVTVASLRNTMTEKKQEFFDRIALVSSSLMGREHEAKLNMNRKNKNAAQQYPLDQVTPQSDLSLPGRHMHIVTTAALPWFTGTAVNPLLRAAYLHRRTQEINNNHTDTIESNNLTNDTNTNTTETAMRWVTLVIPWLELPEDQQALYGKVFPNEQAQEDFIRGWLRNEAGLADAACPATGLQILFYPARYHAGLGSIFAMGDIIGLLPPDKMDVCVLEEVEHLNWYRAPGHGWTKRFQFVVGIVHTSKYSTAGILVLVVDSIAIEVMDDGCCESKMVKHARASLFSHMKSRTHLAPVFLTLHRLQRVRQLSLYGLVDGAGNIHVVVGHGASLLSQGDQALGRLAKLCARKGIDIECAWGACRLFKGRDATCRACGRQGRGRRKS
jgi:hypothetical protein